MAADGLITIEPWQAEHALLAAAEFDDEHLQQAAMVIAALHPHVVDYISQAPVLVLWLACGGRYDLRTREGRLELAKRFIGVAGPSHRLPHILRALGLPPPLRRLAGRPLRRYHHQSLRLLIGIPETTLAQIIPAAAEQAAWLGWLERLLHKSWHRTANGDQFVTWAAANLRTREAQDAAGEIADWAIFEPRGFHPAMSFEQARAGSQLWHRRLVEGGTPRWSPFAGDRDKVIDYAPLPTEVEVDGLTFRALATVADLELESARMHHCVRSYWNLVAQGRSRIYSIRRGQQHVATLELRRPRWRAKAAGPLDMAQLKGPCNASPPPDIALAAARCLEIANAAVAEAVRAKAAAARAEAAEKRRQRRAASAEPVAT